MVGSRHSHRDESLSFSQILSFHMCIHCVHIGGDGDAVSLFHVSISTLKKINILHIIPWRFGSDHFPFLSWVMAVGSSR